MDIRTEKNTAVEGAVIAAENGNLKLDTGTLTYKDIQDKDTGSNTQVSVSGSSGNPLETATLDASYDSHDKRQINRATMGAGTIRLLGGPPVASKEFFEAYYVTGYGQQTLKNAPSLAPILLHCECKPVIIRECACVRNQRKLLRLESQHTVIISTK